MKRINSETDVFRLQGKTLTVLRVTNDLKGGEVAKVLGVTNGYISHCERNRNRLSEEMTQQFLDFIGTTLDEAKVFARIIGN
ncbi:UNVERIFIED_ORG: transcriptional regulator with XRE-family HTH domain [Bacillus sp. B2I3]|nr:transcriptional regulator with XRE-family HTH domain [Bacillus sp. B2I3]